MGENNRSSSLKNNFVTDLEKLEISDADAPVKSTNIDGSENDSIVDAGFSEFKDLSDLDRKLSELQCPFTWFLPRTRCVFSEMILLLTDNGKELEDDGQFTTSWFMNDLLVVYELCNNDKLEEANKKLIIVLAYTKDFYNSCEDEFLAKMKIPLEHVMLSCKAHFLKSYIAKFPLHNELHLQEISEILETVYPYSKMTESEQGGMYYLKGQAFSKYGHSGCVEGLEFMEKAIELDPKEPEWYFQTGKLIAIMRRRVNWNGFVKNKEIKLLKRAVDLYEKPSYLVCLANSYVDCTRNLYRSLQLDKATKINCHDMNMHAKYLYMKSVQLKPDDARLNIHCANSMLRLPKYFVNTDFVRKCIKVALEKAPNNGFVNYTIGKFAERYEYDIEKAIHHYKISSDLSLFGAMSDYIRLKYLYDKDYDLIGGLEKMLECSLFSTQKRKIVSQIGSYYLFLKRDLFRALEYYDKIMQEDNSSSAITVSIPVFLNVRHPLNMYEILCTEVHLKLNEKNLSTEEVNILTEFLNKLKQIDPSIAENFANKPSQIEGIMDKSRKSDEKYKTEIRRNQLSNDDNERGSGLGEVQN